MSTIIVGGNGYIGSTLSKALDANVVDIGWYGSEVSLEKDIRYFDNIILLAGHSSMWMCEQEPGKSWQNNVTVFHNIVNKLPSDKTLIYASSASVYGSNEIDANEENPLSSPICHYDMQKQVLDKVAMKYINEGKNIIGLRFGTVNGISDHTRVDLMINSMVNDAITKGEITLANVDKRRALLFLPDLVEGFKLILENKTSGIYNLSSINITVGEIGDRVSKLLDIPFIINDSIKNPYSFGLDCSKFVNMFGEFKITNIDDIINNLAQNLNDVRKTRRDRLY